MLSDGLDEADLRDQLVALDDLLFAVVRPVKLILLAILAFLVFGGIELLVGLLLKRRQRAAGSSFLGVLAKIRAHLDLAIVVLGRIAANYVAKVSLSVAFVNLNEVERVEIHDARDLVLQQLPSEELLQVEF